MTHIVVLVKLHYYKFYLSSMAANLMQKVNFDQEGLKKNFDP